MRLRSSSKIFIGFVATVAIVWLAFNKVQDWLIMGQKFSPVAPTSVDIVGITPNGYRVIVSNEVAQLVETQGGFQAGQPNEADDSSNTEGAVKKKISVKDMLGVLQGSPKSLSAFLMAMNDINENDLPPVRVEWTKPDLSKALSGDKPLRDKLERDLNMKLDGSPLPELNIAAIQNGIVVDVPVTVDVNIAGRVTPVTGTILYAYKPRMLKAVDADVAQDAGKIDNTTITGYYKQEAEKVLQKGPKENVAQVLKDQISDATAARYAEYPKRILSTATIVVNDNYIDNASYSTYASPNGKPLYALHISLNDEGRRRLWQYSRRRVGDQILLTSNGVAIAVATIQHSLMGGDVTITQMKDQGLLDDLIANIHTQKSRKLAER